MTTAGEERSVRDELNHALVEGAKRIILEKVDEETLRRYLLEETANELHRLLSGWELRETIKQAVNQRLGQRIPEVVNEVLAREDFKNILTDAVASAVKDGIEQGTKALQKRLSQVVGGERAY